MSSMERSSCRLATKPRNDIGICSYELLPLVNIQNFLHQILSTYEIWMTIGPATVMSSVNIPVSGALLARLTYTSPARISPGIRQPLLSMATNAVPPGKPPFVNAQNVAPEADVETCRTVFTLMSAVGVVEFIDGKGVMLRFEPDGHEVMKPAARVKTLRTSNGVSKAEGTATALDAERMKV